MGLGKYGEGGREEVPGCGSKPLAQRHEEVNRPALEPAMAGLREGGMIAGAGTGDEARRVRPERGQRSSFSAPGAALNSRAAERTGPGKGTPQRVG